MDYGSAESIDLIGIQAYVKLKTMCTINLVSQEKSQMLWYIKCSEIKSIFVDLGARSTCFMTKCVK